MRRFLALALMFAAGVAHANGRAPITDAVKFKPGDPMSLYVGTTFGLLVSHDDGCTFRWICEANIGYGGMFDPIYAVAADGTIFATTFFGLRVSRDDGCSFATATAELPEGDPNRLDIWIDALDLGPTGEVWIGTAETTRSNAIYHSTDNGATFAATMPLSPTIVFKSVKVAPANAQRVYATGYEVAGNNPVPHLFITNDGGAQWTESPLANVMFGSVPVLRVLAVDPANPDILYLRSEASNPPMGDRLYRSTDGGVTLTEVVASTDVIRDVVIVDANQVLVATQLDGTYRSTTGGASFEKLAAAPQLMCMGKQADGKLIACGPNWDPDFMAVARSADGGSTWQKVWRFVELAGPRACPAGTAEHDVCDQTQWPNLQAQFGATGPICGDEVMPQGEPPVPPKPGGGGCCDAGNGAPMSALWTTALVFWIARRRRR